MRGWRRRRGESHHQRRGDLHGANFGARLFSLGCTRFLWNRMIRMVNVFKSFGAHHVLRGCSLDVRDGETLTIIGGSGTGKSVTLKLMIGLLKPDRGTIHVDEEEITEL